MATVLGVSKSGYYQYLKARPSSRSQANQHLIEQIKQIHQSSHGTYGSHRIHAEAGQWENRALDSALLD